MADTRMTGPLPKTPNPDRPTFQDAARITPAHIQPYGRVAIMTHAYLSPNRNLNLCTVTQRRSRGELWLDQTASRHRLRPHAPQLRNMFWP
jgi:hypothetical protein